MTVVYETSVLKEIDHSNLVDEREEVDEVSPSPLGPPHIRDHTVEVSVQSVAENMLQLSICSPQVDVLLFLCSGKGFHAVYELCSPLSMIPLRPEDCK